MSTVASMSWLSKLTLAIFFLSLPSLTTAQTKLVIPMGFVEIRQLMSDYDNYCPTCAVVTNVRMINDDGGDVEYSGVDGPEDISGNTVLIRPIISSSRQSTRIASSRQWRITVRYDNGAFAFFEQPEKPEIRKGDEVQIIEGCVQLR